MFVKGHMIMKIMFMEITSCHACYGCNVKPTACTSTHLHMQKPYMYHNKSQSESGSGHATTNMRIHEIFGHEY